MWQLLPFFRESKQLVTNELNDVFISYGRAESKEFAIQLYQKLTEKGFKVWFDQNDIPLAVDFQNQIDDGIEKSKNFIFIIAPHSVQSPYCHKEIELAITLQKRIIPLLHIEPTECWDAMHPTISKINWVYFTQEQEWHNAFEKLTHLLHSHKNYVQQHATLLLHALEWERHQKQTRYLLVGKQRIEAEQWLIQRFEDQQTPCEPTNLHCEYICESTKNAQHLMTQVFFCYHENDIQIMEELRYALMHENITAWSRQSNIRTRLNFNHEVKQGIEGADNFIFLISKSSLASNGCQSELRHAQTYHKRIVPILLEPLNLDSLADTIRIADVIDLNTHSNDESYHATQRDRLLKLLRTDAEYYQQHKVLLVKSLKWLAQERTNSLLLQGYALEHAEAWLKTANNHPSYPPVSTHKRFINASAQSPTGISQEVFISYSRKDADFARKLNNALQLQGKTTWFDQENIDAAIDFKEEIDKGIDSSDNFIFVLSPDAMRSRHSIGEMVYAQKQGKRIIPVLLRHIDIHDLPLQLKNIQWIEFSENDESFYLNFSRLVKVLDTDRDHVRQHTKLLHLARDWETKQYSRDVLLRGSEFTLANLWLIRAGKKHPAPTNLHHKFIRASQYAEQRTHRIRKYFTFLLTGLLIVSVMALGFAVKSYYAETQAHQTALKQKEIAEHNEKKAVSKEKEAKAALKKTQKTQSLFLADLARQANEVHNYTKALLLSLYALPQSLSEHDRPYIPQAQSQLYHAVTHLRERQILETPLYNVTSAQFSKDNTRLYSIEEQSIRLWDIETGKELHTFVADMQEIVDYLISEDDKYVIASTEEQKIYIWDTTTGRLLHILNINQALTQLRFSANQHFLYIVAHKNIQIWDIKTGKQQHILQASSVIQHIATYKKENCLISLHDNQVIAWNQHKNTPLYRIHLNTDNIDANTFVFNQTGSHFLLLNHGMAEVRETKTGRLLFALDKHNKSVQLAQFSPDNQSIITFGDEVAWIWDAVTGLPLYSIPLANQKVQKVVFIPEQSQVLIISMYSAQLWDIYQGQLLHTFTPPKEKYIVSAGFSPDGDQMYMIINDHSIHFWDIPSYQHLLTLAGHQNFVHQLVFNQRRKYLVFTVADDKTLRFWSVVPHNTLTPKVLKAHEKGISRVLLSPDGKNIFTAGKDNKVIVWELKSGQFLQEFITTEHPILDIKFDQDGHYLLTHSLFQHTIWDTESSLLLSQYEGFGRYAQFSADYQRVVIAGKRAYITEVLDVQTKQQVFPLSGHSIGIFYAKFSPNDKYIVTLSEEGTIDLWSGENGAHIKQLSKNKSLALSKAYFSPKLDRLLVTTEGNTALLWDINTDRLLATLHGHSDKITSAAFSQDGAFVVTSSQDKTAILWDTFIGERILTFVGHTDTVTDAVFSLDSQHVITTSDDKTARIWRTFSSRQALIYYANELKPRQLTATERHLAFIEYE